MFESTHETNVTINYRRINELLNNEEVMSDMLTMSEEETRTIELDNETTVRIDCNYNDYYEEESKPYNCANFEVIVTMYPFSVGFDVQIDEDTETGLPCIGRLECENVVLENHITL